MSKSKIKYSNTKVNSIIGEDVILDGNVRAKEPVLIDGEIHGDVYSESMVILGKNGKIEGGIEAVNIIVGGTVDGDLTSYGRIEIIAGGKVGGNIKTKSLIIDENALFQGQCTMFKDDLSQGTKTEETKTEEIKIDETKSEESKEKTAE